MKVLIRENFGQQRESEIVGANWEEIYYKAMELFEEKSKMKISDEYYYTYEIIKTL